MELGLEDEHGGEHEKTAEHREQDELDRGVDPPASPPDPDDERHRDEHGLPEDIKEEQVLGDEDPEDAGFEEEHEEAEFLDAGADRSPGREQGHGHQEGRQGDEEETDPVDPHVVPDAVAYPGPLFHELGPARPGVEPGHEDQGQDENGRRRPKGHEPDGPDAGAGDEDQREGSGQGEERDQAQRRHLRLTIGGTPGRGPPREGRRGRNP